VTARKPARTSKTATTASPALRQAAAHRPAWQTVLEALILVAETDARRCLRALNRHIERVFNPDRKDHHWGRRKLARDR